MIFGTHSHRVAVPFKAPFRTWDFNGAQSVDDMTVLRGLVKQYGDVLHTLGPIIPTPEQVTAIVKTGIKSLEVWNEPDLTWAGNPGDLMNLSAMVYQTAKAANPNIIIVSPGTIDGGWFAQYIMAGDPDLWLDVIGVHTYADDLMDWWDLTYKVCMGLRDSNTGNLSLRNKPIWVTETGMDWQSKTAFEWQQFFMVGEALKKQVPTLERIYVYSYDQNPDDEPTRQFNYQTDAAFQAWSQHK